MYDYINEDFIKNDETYHKIINDTIKNLNKTDEIELDINEIRKEIKKENQLNTSLFLILSSLI